MTTPTDDPVPGLSLAVEVLDDRIADVQREIGQDGGGRPPEGTDPVAGARYAELVEVRNRLYEHITDHGGQWPGDTEAGGKQPPTS